MPLFSPLSPVQLNSSAPGGALDDAGRAYPPLKRWAIFGCPAGTKKNTLDDLDADLAIEQHEIEVCELWKAP